MTRYRRRRLTAAAKFAGLLLIPLAAAGAAKGVTAMRSAVTAMGTITVGEPAPRRLGHVGLNRSNTADELYGELILSEGYGYMEEVEEDTQVRLLSPLEMKSANAGDKPYPTSWSDGVPIVRTTYGRYSGSAYFDLEKCGQVNNKSDIPNETLCGESRMLPDFRLKDTDSPQVLIYHTHTTESYEPFVRENMDDSFNYRTTDDTKNMIMVGNAIQAELEAAGIGVIHVTTVHDYPSYNGSYGRSRESIVPVLEQYPEIKVALDIHRDAISGDTYAAQPYVTIDGREAAQVMIISGCDDGTLDMPNYLKNFHFACTLQQQLEGDFPGFTRPILFDYRHYNQDLTTGSLLIEVGSHGNTLEQAQYSGQLIGRSLVRVLNRLKE